jgi:7-cyano-7-deazaguanine synthase in queuosine biosynthesis
MELNYLNKLSVLTTIAGYLQKNDIFIEDFVPNVKSMESFLSFLLNHKKFAPIKYKIRIHSAKKTMDKKYSQSAKNEYDLVILFSGGVDSSSSVLYALDYNKKPLLLWVKFGQKNEHKEESVVDKFSKKLSLDLFKIRIKLKKYVDEGWKIWDYIVPARNFIFATFGALVLANSVHNNGKIILAATEEEVNHPNPSPDKSKKFYNYCSNLFSNFSGKDIELTTYFRNIGKAELVAHWNNVWREKYGISPHETTTCYYGNNCGECKACLKRSIAFLAAGIGLDKDLKKNPFANNPNFVDEYLERCLTSKDFTFKRKIDTLLAFTKMIDYLSDKSRKRLLNLPRPIKNALSKREKELRKFIIKRVVEENNF